MTPFSFTINTQTKAHVLVKYICHHNLINDHFSIFKCDIVGGHSFFLVGNFGEDVVFVGVVVFLKM